MDESNSNKYYGCKLAIYIILISCPSNTFAEGLGRQGTLTRSKLRMRMTPGLCEAILLVYMNTCDRETLEEHIHHLIHLHTEVIQEKKWMALPLRGNRDRKKAFEVKLCNPRKRPRNIQNLTRKRKLTITKDNVLPEEGKD